MGVHLSNKDRGKSYLSNTSTLKFYISQSEFEYDLSSVKKTKQKNRLSFETNDIKFAFLATAHIININPGLEVI